MKKLTVLIVVLLIQFNAWGQWSEYSFTGEEKEIMEVIEKETLSFLWVNTWIGRIAGIMERIFTSNGFGAISIIFIPHGKSSIR